MAGEDGAGAVRFHSRSPRRDRARRGNLIIWHSNSGFRPALPYNRVMGKNPVASRNALIVLLFATGCQFAPALAASEAVRFATVDFAPYALNDGKGERRGLIVDINAAIAARALPVPSPVKLLGYGMIRTRKERMPCGALDSPGTVRGTSGGWRRHAARDLLPCRAQKPRRQATRP